MPRRVNRRILRERGQNIIVSYESFIMGSLTRAQNGALGYKCDLPVPFRKGKPADFTKMSAGELRCLIRFAYRSQFKKTLPVTLKRLKPDWWSENVSFDKALTVSTSGKVQNPQNEASVLAELLKSFYSSFGMTSLLAIAQRLANPKENGMRLVRGKANDPWAVVTRANNLILLIDLESRTYDAEENYQYGSQKPVASLPSENSLSDRPVTRVDAKNRKPVKQTNVNGFVRRTGRNKRNLVEMEKETLFECQHCKEAFKQEEFCSDHEKVCTRRPGWGTQANFMNALGLCSVGASPSPKERPPPPSQEDSGYDSVGSASRQGVRRTLRKLPKRNQLISILRNNQLALSSAYGQKLLSQLNEKVDHAYPPHYEKNCEPSKQSRYRERTREYPDVSKASIKQDAEYPHIFSYGRRQRQLRNQELIIGLSSHCWKFLNQCKTARLVLDKVKPMTSTTIKDNTSDSYVRQKLRGAVILPRIYLCDIIKAPTPDVMKFLQRKSDVSSL